MTENIALLATTGTNIDFTADYHHINSDTTGQLHILVTADSYAVSGTLHTGETVNELVPLSEEEVTPEQIFWLVAEVLEALLCPECGDKTDPE